VSAAATEPLDPWGPTDPLGRALQQLRMDGAFYCHSELTAPWGFSMPAMPGYVWFHVVLDGGLEIDSGDGEPLALGAGELALVPHGEGHDLRSAPGVATPGILDLPREELGERFEVLRHGGGGAPTTLVCGAVRLEHPSSRNLVRALPATIVVDSRSRQREWIRASVGMLAAEAGRSRPGMEAVITRIADVIVIQAIREWIETDPAARSGWLGALRDPQVGRAIALVHAEPAREWTVEALARELSMSRSAFSARFTELVGEPVMRYVTRWRMQVALEALQAGETTVAAQADALGYRSEAAFSRAFKRVLGESPGAARRRVDPAAALAG
jgi:AraC-like DNA-binding protein